jgi:hypothetical protein
LGILVDEFLKTRFLFERFRQGDVQLVGNELGDTVGVAVRHVQRTSHVANDGSRLNGAEGDDLGHTLLASVPVRYVLNHLVAVGHAEVHVDIRHRLTFQVQETFKQEVVRQGVDVGDPHGIGGQAAGSGTPPGTHRTSVAFTVLDEVGNDEKVSGETHLLNDVQLDFEAISVLPLTVSHVRVDGTQLGKSPFQPDAAFILENLVHALSGFHMKQRKVMIAEFQFQVALVRDANAVFKSVGYMSESRRHVRG